MTEPCLFLSLSGAIEFGGTLKQLESRTTKRVVHVRRCTRSAQAAKMHEPQVLPVERCAHDVWAEIAQYALAALQAMPAAQAAVPQVNADGIRQGAAIAGRDQNPGFAVTHRVHATGN